MAYIISNLSLPTPMANAPPPPSYFPRASSRLETDLNAGTCHLLELMAFKSTGIRSHQQVGKICVRVTSGLIDFKYLTFEYLPYVSVNLPCSAVLRKITQGALSPGSAFIASNVAFLRKKKRELLARGVSNPTPAGPVK